MITRTININCILNPEWILDFFSKIVLSEKAQILTNQAQAEALKESALDIDDIRKSFQGDPDAYKRLIERHQQQISKIMWRFSRDPLIHEELIQDVFVEAYFSLSKYQNRAPFIHWLTKIATRVGYHYWKEQSRQRKLKRFSFEDWDQLTLESPEKIDPGQAADLLHRLLSQLPPRDRLVLTLRYLEGCNIAEVARRIGWTKSMVKVQTNRAKKKLEKLLMQMKKRPFYEK